MSNGEAIEMAARRAVQAILERRRSMPELPVEVREFIGRTGAEAADVLERIAADSLKDEQREDDAYYCYIAADFVRAIAVAALRNWKA